MGYEDGKVLRTQPLSGFKVGRIYAIEEYEAYFGVNDVLIEEGEITAIKYTIYDNYAYDKIEKKYIGVGEIISGAICTSGPFWPIKEY